MSAFNSYWTERLENIIEEEAILFENYVNSNDKYIEIREIVDEDYIVFRFRGSNGWNYKIVPIIDFYVKDNEGILETTEFDKHPNLPEKFDG